MTDKEREGRGKAVPMPLNHRNRSAAASPSEPPQVGGDNFLNKSESEWVYVYLVVEHSEYFL